MFPYDFQSYIYILVKTWDFKAPSHEVLVKANEQGRRSEISGGYGKVQPCLCSVSHTFPTRQEYDRPFRIIYIHFGLRELSLKFPPHPIHREQSVS